MTSPADPLLNFERCGAGEPMLLVHGVGSDSCVWEPVIGALAVHFDVIAVDLPGFGRSNALPDDVVPTPRALSAAVAALLDELGIERVHAVGNSLGGCRLSPSHQLLDQLRRPRGPVVGRCPAA
jgi:pimeloyl-ACP methyl ester carboxylesterase